VSQKKVSKKVAYTAAALCIVLLAALGVIVNGIIQETAKHQENQPTPQATAAAGTPKLETVELKCSVENGKLHVTGYVKNVGDAKANNCTLHVNSVVDGEAGAELSAPLGSFEAGEQRAVDLEFPFTANGLAAFNTYLKWTN
jgi:hypothetical protein